MTTSGQLRLQVSDNSSLCNFREEFKKVMKSFVARAQPPHIQIGTDCLSRSRALATKAVLFRLVWLRSMVQQGSVRVPRLDGAVHLKRFVQGASSTVLAGIHCTNGRLV